jgi:predicted  nucleic acid-binding Zn-ribbon protein
MSVFVPLSTFSENIDQESQIRQLQNTVYNMQRTNKSIQKDNSALKTKMLNLSNELNAQAKAIDSLEAQVLENKTNGEKSANELGAKIDSTDKNTVALSKSVDSKTIIAIVAVVVLLIFLGLVYFLLHNRIRKSNDDIVAMKDRADELSSKADDLNAKIVEHFSSEVTELQKLSESAATLSKSTGQSGNNDEQDLIKTLADRITFMEMTLYRMDNKVRGYKQLTKSISQMKDNLSANGYEIVDMLGKPYNQGMKVTANFIEDENLEQGQQIITGIIKPQINYKGKMIQAAQITVSQNI